VVAVGHQLLVRVERGDGIEVEDDGLAGTACELAVDRKADVVGLVNEQDVAAEALSTNVTITRRRLG
jgi:hypothetical protein